MTVFHLFFKQSFPSSFLWKGQFTFKTLNFLLTFFLYIPKLNHKRLLRDWSYVFIVLRFWHKRYWQLYGSFHPHSERFVYSWFGFLGIYVETWCRLWLTLRYWKSIIRIFDFASEQFILKMSLSHLMFHNSIIKPFF